MTTDEAHELAMKHKTYLAGVKRAEWLRERARKQARKKAERMENKAYDMLEAARVLLQRAGRYDFGKEAYERLEEAAYWAAREEIGK